MSHPAVEAWIDQSLDDELSAADAAELAVHLEGCERCRGFREERLALRAAIAEQIPRFEAPGPLRERMRAEWRAHAGARSPKPVRRLQLGYWVGLAAALAIVAVTSWQVSASRAGARLLADEVLATHVRSLMPGHLTDVISTDQHTVKPWFNGRLDFSPPVYDFAGRGYPLAGGRLDYLHGRTVAALVYTRRKHLINVFVWPAGGEAAGGGKPRFVQGYHLLRWVTPDYQYWVVSDLGIAELSEFAGLIQAADSAAAPAPPSQ
ncbi:MAG TPA: zf-HC2 domain-containing protein [Gemmatimonadales bacterium]|nr:zf-HC2 domain-containing protein [Gemmatimonadales bacterium]